MAHYPQSTSGLTYVSYPVGPDPIWTEMTSGGTNHTKGSYLEIVASSPFTCNSILAWSPTTTNVSGRLFLFDIATGAAASEVVLLPNIPLEGSVTSAGLPADGGAFPIGIASGTRIASRVQCSTASTNARLQTTLIAAGDTPGVSTAWVNYGIDTSTTQTTSVDPGGVANTKGSYVEVTSSTSAVAQVLSVFISARGNTAPATAFWSIDIAVGAAASEVVLIPDLPAVTTTTVGSLRPKWRTMLTYIAASARIAARASCNITAATDRIIGIGLAAATAPAESAGGGGTHAHASFG